MTTTELDVPALIDGRKIGGFQILVVTLCALVMILDGFDTQAISYIAPRIAQEWHLSRAALGPIFSSGLTGLMIGYLLLPPLSDRYGHRRMILAGTVFFGIVTLLTARAVNLEQLIVLRLLTGIGLGAVAPSAIALVGEYSPKRLRASFILLIYCGFSLGFILAGWLAAMLLPVWGWRALLLAGGIFPLVLGVVLAFALPESLDYLVLRRHDLPRAQAVLRRLAPEAAIDAQTHLRMAQQRPAGMAVRQLFRDGRGLGTILLWAIFFINLAEFYALQSWLPSILAGLHYALPTIALLTSLTTVGGIVVAVVVGPAMDKLGPYSSVTVLYGLGAAIVALLGAALHAAPWVLMLATFWSGVCISGGQKSVIALAAIYYPATIRSTGVGWALGIGRFGGIAGPLVVGYAFAQHWTAEAVFYAAGVPMLAAAIAVWLVGARRPQEGRSATIPGTYTNGHSP